MNFYSHHQITRRSFLGKSAQGLGAVALASLMQQTSLHAASSRGAINPLPLPQKAKRVIWLTMAGGPSHLETFDPKPTLAKMHGQPMPESMTKGQQLAQLQTPSHPVSAPRPGPLRSGTRKSNFLSVKLVLPFN